MTTTSEYTTAPDNFLNAALTEHGNPLTGDAYVEHVLLARQRAWSEQHTATAEGEGLTIRAMWTPLLADFVLDADIPYVQLPDPEPPRSTSPRKYRPASYWRIRVQKIDKEMQALSTPLINDRAAARGAALGVKRTRRMASREDSRLARYTALQRRHLHAQRMLRAAEAREAHHTML